MIGSSQVAPGPAARSARLPWRSFVLPALAVAAAGAALVVLSARPDDTMLDYGVGIVPVIVPFLAALVAVAVAAIGMNGRASSSAAGSLLMVTLVVTAAWSVAMLPFDALRIVGLVPLPLSGGGLLLRLLVLTAGTAALVPVLRARRAGKGRCAECGRILPGPLDQVPRWPVVLAVAFALPYPVMRVIWALGGTLGTTGEPLDLDPAVAWGAALAGWVLVAFAVVLFVGKGPVWLRALLGLGGVVAGLALTVDGGLAALGALTMLATNGPQSSPGAGLTTWTFLVVYGSWFIAGMGVMAGSWRYWAHRRDECPTCGPLLESGRTVARVAA